MAEDVLKEAQSYINEEVELDCSQVSKIFTKIKNKGILQNSIHYYTNNYNVPWTELNILLKLDKKEKQVLDTSNEEEIQEEKKDIDKER